MNDSLAQNGPTTKLHYLVVTYASWAHIRSELSLCHTILSINPDLLLTILIPSNRAGPAAKEMAQYPFFELAKDRYNLIHYGTDTLNDGDGLWNPKGGFREQNLVDLKGWAEKIANREALIDTLSNKLVQAFDLPYNAIIGDISLTAWLLEAKAAIGKAQNERVPPVIAFAPYNVAFPAILFCDELADFPARVKKVADAEAEALQLEIYNKELFENEGLIEIEGLSPFHRYEDQPNHTEAQLRFPVTLHRLGTMLMKFLDGMIVAWPSFISHQLRDAMSNKWDAFYAIGPGLPAIDSEEWGLEGDTKQVREYLDSALNVSGPRSVLYISFGSVLFSPKHHQLSVLLDVLRELKIKYIMAEGNNDIQNRPLETLKMMRDRVGKEGDLGLLVKWAPQRLVLNHPATALFLTHAGSNSAMEGILAKVPMIAWPAGFDQPLIANELHTLGVARELFQIRNGASIGRKVARNGLLVTGTDEAIREEFIANLGNFNSDTIRKMRDRLEIVSKQIVEDLKSGGARMDLEKLAHLSFINH